MKKFLVAIAAAALVAAALSSPAQAHCRGCVFGAGVIGGLAAGAIIGSAIANSPPAYAGPAPVYDAPPPSVVYVEPPPMPVCHIEQRNIWVPGYGWQPRRVEVCN